MIPSEFRIERDALGQREVPAHRYYGIQTVRALEAFPVSGRMVDAILLQAYCEIKRAAAIVNERFGVLDHERAQAMRMACDEMLSGKFQEEIVVDVFQSGAGTSLNMNLNEVLANRALELLGRARGDYGFLSPNDHVNCSQSTNDTFPTAMHIATISRWQNLKPIVGELAQALEERAQAFHGIIKSGRTHLKDAVPMRLGDEFTSWAQSFRRSVRLLDAAANELLEVAIGGTAIGSGLNTPEGYAQAMVVELSRRLGFRLSLSPSLYEATASRQAMGAFSAALRALALECVRITSDLALLSSGPMTGLAEITLPAVLPGSSIMPAKVNPSLPECLKMIAFEVIGNDATVALAVQAGQLELNVMTPVMIHKVLESLRLLTNFLPIFTNRCIRDITANAERCRAYADRSAALATALVPTVGYHATAELIQQSLDSGRSVRELAVKQGVLSVDAALRLLDPSRALGPQAKQATNTAGTIVDFLEASARRMPQKVALLFEGRSYTYKELHARSGGISAELARRFPAGAVVAILLGNGPEFIASYFGTLAAGLPVLLLAPNISDEQFSFELKHTNARALLTEQRYQGKVARTGFTTTLECFFVDAIAPAMDGVLLRRDISPESISTILFTSGSTGKPKGVALRHRNVVAATAHILEVLKFSERDIDANVSSLAHSFGLGNLHCVFAVGGTVLLFRDTIDLGRILSMVVSKRATTLGAVPAVLRQMLLLTPEQLRACGKHLRLIQTNMSPLETSLVKGILTSLPATDFFYYYGLTEASRSTLIALNREVERRESVGRPSAGVRVKIIDERGQELPAGVSGEICISGPHVIDGYWQDPEASRSIRDGWLHTGDVGFLDRDGYLSVTGRVNDVMNIAGEKVAPEEVESIALAVSGVTGAVAVSVSDRMFGDRVKLYITVNDPGFRTDQVLAECRQRLEHYKVPREVEVIDEIPRTDNGKVRRHILRQRALKTANGRV